MSFTREGAINTEVWVDLGSVEVRIDQGANLPIKRCELTKVQSTKMRADHKPCHVLS